MTKTLTTVIIPPTVYFHCISIVPWHKLCPLIWVYNYYICLFDFFYWSRPYWCLLLINLLPFQPNLRLWQLLLLYPTNVHPWCLSSYLSSSLLLSLQCLSKFVTLSYYCLMLLEDHSTSISFLLIILFIPLLNSSTNSLSLYLLLLTALLNFCTNFSIILFFYSTLFNSTTFIVLLFSLSNFFFGSTKIFSTVLYSKISTSRFSKTFSFQIFADSFYIYIIASTKFTLLLSPLSSLFL